MEQTEKSNEEVVKIRLGDHVIKVGGDYSYDGIVVSVFHKCKGAIRVVVENKDGILHIFNPSQLQLI